MTPQVWVPMNEYRLHADCQRAMEEALSVM